MGHTCDFLVTWVTQPTFKIKSNANIENIEETFINVSKPHRLPVDIVADQEVLFMNNSLSYIYLVIERSRSK